MKYTIGEFAELLGVTVDTLRLYEKYEIIQAIKNKKNNYRYFDDFDARNMLMSRWYRSFQIPIQEAAQLTQQASFESIKETIQKRKMDLEEEVKKKIMLLEKMNEISENIEDIGRNLNKCTLKKLPGIYRLRQTDKNNLVRDAALVGQVEEWMKLLPYVFFSFRIINTDVLSSVSCFDYNWGLALFENDIKKLSIDIDENVEYIESKSYLSCIIASCNDYITRESVQFMFEHLSINQYTIDGDIFGKIILTENTGSNKQYYLEVDIPIILNP